MLHFQTAQMNIFDDQGPVIKNVLLSNHLQPIFIVLFESKKYLLGVQNFRLKSISLTCKGFDHTNSRRMKCQGKKMRSSLKPAKQVLNLI